MGLLKEESRILVQGLMRATETNVFASKVRALVTRTVPFKLDLTNPHLMVALSVKVYQ